MKKLATFLVFAFCSFSTAQNDPNADAGLKPYGAFQGSDIDVVSLSNGKLSVIIPFFSYSQRGKVKLEYRLQYTQKDWRTKQVCNALGDCWLSWLPMTGTSVKLTTSNDLSSSSQTIQLDAFTTVTVSSLVTADGGSHYWASSGGVKRTIDSTGFLSSSAGISDRSGVLININKDSNGNVITRSSVDNSKIDSLNRTTPVSPVNSVGNITNPTDPSGCTGPRPTHAAGLWTVPGPTGAGGTSIVKFCTATVPLHMDSADGDGPAYDAAPNLLQSVVLPDGSAYTFEYLDNTGFLSKITLPTGGTISYSVGGFNGVCAGSYSSSVRPFAYFSRTLDANDGTGPHTWSYNYGSETYVNGVITRVGMVTDPLGNDAVHTLTGLGNTCSFYETQLQQYQGSHTTGTLLKTVNTTYSHAFDPFSRFSGFASSRGNAVPTRIVTIWPNGKQSEVDKTYDAGFTFSDPDPRSSTTYTGIYGTVLSESAYDYGQGVSGPLLKQTATSYAWQAGNPNYQNYLTANFLDLPVSMKVFNGAGYKCAETDYTYDDPARLFVPNPAITTQHGSAPFSVRGNISGITRQLSLSPCTSGATWQAVTSYVNVYDTGMTYQDIDPLSRTTTYSYDAAFVGAYRTRTDYPDTTSPNLAHHFIIGNYDFNSGLLTSFTDQNRQPHNYAYDNMWRMTSATYPPSVSGQLSDQITFTFPNATTTERLETLDQSQIKDKFTYFDGFARAHKTKLASDPEGANYIRMDYDALGRALKQWNPTRCDPDAFPDSCSGESTFGSSLTQYDILNRILSVTEQDNSSVQMSYSANCVTTTDESMKQLKSCSDALGRITQVVEDPAVLNYETDYQYDALGNLKRVDQKGSAPSDSTQWRTRTFTYDSFSRLLAVTNPESGNITYTYDSVGNALTKTSPQANQTGTGTTTTSYCYDALNRLLSKRYTTPNCVGTSPVANYFYDQTTYNGQTITNGIGRRTGMSDSSGNTAWSYDAMGRVLAERRTISGITKTTSYSYNRDGSLATTTYPSGCVITNLYNAAGYLLSAADVPNAINYVTAAKYAPRGALSGIKNGASINGGFTYNSRMQPLQIAYGTGTLPSLTGTTCPTGASILHRLYDFHLGNLDNGNVHIINNCKDANRTQNFFYDSLNRITQAYTTGNSPLATSWGETFTIDAWGNVTNKGPVTGKTYTETLNAAPANGKNQLNGFCNDTAGNLLLNTACPTGTFTPTYSYDNENKLISAAAGYSYIYDGDGKRVKKCTNSGCTTATLYWNGISGDPLAESNVGGTFTEEYIFFNGKRVARRDVSGGAVHYYFSDFLGSAAAITGSGGATIQKESDYFPFGGELVVSGTDINNYKFTGKERDSESGLDMFGARYYGSSLGRFMTPDWAANAIAVPYANFGDPQTLNLYGYVRNNPLSKADLDGHVAGVDDATIVTAAAVTYGVLVTYYVLTQPQTQHALSDASSAAVGALSSLFSSKKEQNRTGPNQPQSNHGRAILETLLTRLIRMELPSKIGDMVLMATRKQTWIAVMITGRAIPTLTTSGDPLTALHQLLMTAVPEDQCSQRIRSHSSSSHSNRNPRSNRSRNRNRQESTSQ
jgi:RHS repeat-associated protein